MPPYFMILVFVITNLAFEIIFERILKLRSKIQKKIKSKSKYVVFSLSIILLISILSDAIIKKNMNSQISNLVVIALLVFLMDLSKFNERR